MNQYAVLAAKTVNYTNAGTIEFIVSPKGEFFYGNEYPNPGRAWRHRNGYRHGSDH